MHRLTICAVAVLLLAGCSNQPIPTASPNTAAPVVVAATDVRTAPDAAAFADSLSPDDVDPADLKLALQTLLMNERRYVEDSFAEQLLLNEMIDRLDRASGADVGGLLPAVRSLLHGFVG